MSAPKHEIIIIGAGLAGLACALELQKNGRTALLLEQSDGPGGRVRTDEHEGFLLDRGFQVYLDSYQAAGELFDLTALDLKKFEPGALVFSNNKLHRVMDVFRRPQYLWDGLLAPIGNLFDKALVARLRTQLKNSTLESIAEREEQTTEDYLRRFGFSKRMNDGFFRSFYGGIFLERELLTSSRMFEFTFKMFAEGSATLPAKGMGELPKQLAARLPKDQLKYQCQVSAINGNKVRLSSGENLKAAAIVLATPFDTTRTLVPEIELPQLSWRSVTNLYFSAPCSPLSQPILALNGENTGLVNNVAVLSDLSPYYAPEGKALISVSVLGLPKQVDLANQVKEELTNWFGEEVSQWNHLRTVSIPHALPVQALDAEPCEKPKPPLYLCGDYLASASIEGAIQSGTKAARNILADLPQE